MKPQEFFVRLKDGLFKDGFDVNRRNFRLLREQPLAREHWLAEDVALGEIFHSLNDPQMNDKIARSAENLYRGLFSKHRVEAGQEPRWRELCFRNARRIVWSAVEMTHTDVREEMSPIFARIMQNELEKMGVWEEHLRLYPEGMITTDPVEPYFS